MTVAWTTTRLDREPGRVQTWLMAARHRIRYPSSGRFAPAGTPLAAPLPASGRTTQPAPVTGTIRLVPRAKAPAPAPAKGKG